MTSVLCNFAESYLMKCLLRVEAVNFDNFISDTDDLSTVRGAGLMVLDLSDSILAWAASLEEIDSCTLVTSGASQAIVEIEAAEAEAKELKHKLGKYLRLHREFRYVTFVVDFVTDAFSAESREKLLARARRQQMHSLRLSPAGLYADRKSDHFPPWCSVDMVRPATRVAEKMRNEDKSAISESVSVRRSFGWNRKQDFYQAQTSWAPDNTVHAAWDLNGIGEFDTDTESILPPSARNLNGKIAVVYADGNKFGSKQMEKCVDLPSQRLWDDAVQSIKREALDALLKKAKHKDRHDPTWWNTGRAKENWLRLETLMWGGDELLLVVPAWKAFETILTLFGVNRKHELFGDLTFSVGVVFCHSNAPIQRIRRLASSLVDQVKASQEEEEDAFAYSILESYDHLGQEVIDARVSQLPYPPCEDQQRNSDRLNQLVVQYERLEPLLRDIAWMRENFPRGSAYRLMDVLRTDWREEEDKDKDLQKEFSRWFNRATRDIPNQDNDKAKAALARFRLKKEHQDEDTLRADWLHLVELWDYVVEEAKA